MVVGIVAVLAPLTRVPVAAQPSAARPVNDAYARAIELSSLTIPVGDPAGVAVDGTTEGATVEDGETDDAVASVWYRYTSTSFAGRLGHSVTAGVQVTAYRDCGSVPPAAGCEALGGSSPAFVRMEPGHTVWFRVWSSEPAGAPFTLTLSEAPNPARSIATAPSPVLDPGGIGPTETRVSMTGDTSTPAGPGGPAPAVSWYTFTLGEWGPVSFEATMETAAGLPCESCAVRMRVWQARSAARATDPADPWLFHTVDALTTVPPTTFWLIPGRWYVSFEPMAGPPAFFTATLVLPPGWTSDGTPPRVEISSPPQDAVYSTMQWPELEYACTDDSGMDPSAVVAVDGEVREYPWNLPRTPGTHRIEVRCTDPSGNAATATVDYTVLVPGYVLSTSGPASVTEGVAATIEVIVTHGGGADPVRGFQVGVESAFTLRIAPGTMPPGVACVGGSSTSVNCSSTDELVPGTPVRLPFTITAPAGHLHAPCQLFGAGRYDGPICANVTARPLLYSPTGEQLPVDEYAVLSVPLAAPYLRFEASAPDTPTGATVPLTIRPRNPGTGTLPDLGFVVAPQYPFGPAAFVSADAPPGWTCTPVSGRVEGYSIAFSEGSVLCRSATATLASGETGPPVVLRFRTPAPAPQPGCTWLWPEPATPSPVPCGGFLLSWIRQQEYIIVESTAFRILPEAPSGPCLIVETAALAYGAVMVGTAAEAPVRVRSCSAGPVQLTVSVTDAAGAGTDVWTVADGLDPPAGRFSMTVAPGGGAPLRPITRVPVAAGDLLAAGATRDDRFRLRLGPTGPGIGTRFHATVTYTATEP